MKPRDVEALLTFVDSLVVLGSACLVSVLVLEQAADRGSWRFLGDFEIAYVLSG